MNWRALCGEKLVTPEQALEFIQPTDRVFIAGLQSTPFTLCRALIEKRAELRCRRARSCRKNVCRGSCQRSLPGR